MQDRIDWTKPDDPPGFVLQMNGWKLRSSYAVQDSASLRHPVKSAFLFEMTKNDLDLSS